MDLREHAMEQLASGQTTYEVAAALKVAVSSVIEWADRKRRLGSFAPSQMGGHKPRRTSGDHRVLVLDTVAKGSHVTLHQLADQLEERGLVVHPASVGRSLQREGKSYKKTVLSAEQAKPGVARRREQWRRCQSRIDPARLVFIDETWVKTHMAPLRGWRPRNKRLVAHALYGHWKTMTFIAGLRHDRIDAPWVLNGPSMASRSKPMSRWSRAKRSGQATSSFSTISEAIKLRPCAR